MATCAECATFISRRIRGAQYAKNIIHMKISISVVPILRLVLSRLSSKLGARTFMNHEYVFNGFPREVLFFAFGNAGVANGDQGYADARHSRANPKKIFSGANLANLS